LTIYYCIIDIIAIDYFIIRHYDISIIEAIIDIHAIISPLFTMMRHYFTPLMMIDTIYDYFDTLAADSWWYASAIGWLDIDATFDTPSDIISGH